MNEPVTLGDALPKEIERVERCLEHYQEIGPAGAFARLALGRALASARAAIAEGDVVAMLRAYQELKGCE